MCVCGLFFTFPDFTTQFFFNPEGWFLSFPEKHIELLKTYLFSNWSRGQVIIKYYTLLFTFWSACPNYALFWRGNKLKVNYFSYKLTTRFKKFTRETSPSCSVLMVKEFLKSLDALKHPEVLQQSLTPHRTPTHKERYCQTAGPTSVLQVCWSLKKRHFVHSLPQKFIKIISRNMFTVRQRIYIFQKSIRNVV